MAGNQRANHHQSLPETTSMKANPFIGIWVTADGEFVDDVLYRGGMILFREEQAKR